MSDGTRVMWMRGGTSKAGYFLASDLPDDPAVRDALLLRIMGSPDPRQIDGMGGGDPLTSKVAVVQRSKRPGVDVDYLFLQVFVDTPTVTDAQNCGNILAGVGPFAIERGLVAARDPETPVTIYMENTGQTATARVPTPGAQVTYDGTARIDGVPDTAAAIPLEFRDTAGSTCGALFPTGAAQDRIRDIAVTLIDNGMPLVVIRAADLGLTGSESPAELDANTALKSRLEALRLKAGPLMNIEDVASKSIPKMTLVAVPVSDGAITSRTFIPHRCHQAIGVLGAISLATACLTPGTTAHPLAVLPEGREKMLDIEHPTGALSVLAQCEGRDVTRTEVLRTARKLMDGQVF